MHVHCPNCGAPMRVAGPGSYLYCQYCSTFHFPTASRDAVDILGVESAHACAMCAGVLVAAAVADVPVLYCRQCHGLLIAQTSFGALVSYLRARSQHESPVPRPLNRDDLRRTLPCPHCQRLMDTHPYYGPGNIVIDVCPHCALVWLDHGELEAVISAPRWPGRTNPG